MKIHENSEEKTQITAVSLGLSQLFALSWRHVKLRTTSTASETASSTRNRLEVDTGEWAECCRRPLIHPDDEEGLKRGLKAS